MKTSKGKQITSFEVAEYFLSLDPKRKYFIKDKAIKIDGNSAPTVGNLRLNKLLQITQMLYAAKKGKYLFNDKFWLLNTEGWFMKFTAVFTF